MRHSRLGMVVWVGLLVTGGGGGTAVAAGTLHPPDRLALNELAEFAVAGVAPGPRPFDPTAIRVDARFTPPSGKAVEVPAFWHQEFTSRQVNGRETLQIAGPPGWRVRFTPRESGHYSVAVTVQRTGEAAPLTVAEAAFDVPASGAAARPGFARVAANRRYFESDDGRPLPLIGHCVCWHHQRGTEDYREWFEAMSAVGENYTRLWMWPNSFGLEAAPGTLTNYRLDKAWQLDRVFRLARERGIWLMLCFEYHGMFQTTPDFWGGNNNWKLNPYKAANGGPCANPNAFFTQPEAKSAYQARLRYLIARYGAFPNLLAWQFFNEIDNVYEHLNHADVVAWHAEMGDWLKAHDPWGHLVTTSLTGGSDRPDFWRLPQMDFSMYHSYAQARPAEVLPRIVAGFLTRYDKPVMVGEFGTDWRGWKREQDPFLRGWRQGLWSAALGGAVGSAMSWWWEAIHAENLYPTLGALRRFLDGTGFARGAWTPIPFPPPAPPPAEVGSVLPGGAPFDVTLVPDLNWGTRVSGRLAIVNAAVASRAAANLNRFVHGTSHADLRRPFRLSAWFGPQARLVLRLNSVSEGAILSLRVDGEEKLHRVLPNKDGQHEVNGEYNEDIPLPIPAGKHLVEVRNAGADWLALDHVRLYGLLPSSYAQAWKPDPVACGLRGPGEVLLYLVNPAASYPVNATAEVVPPLTGGRLRVPNLPAGKYRAEWFQPASGRPLPATDLTASGDELLLPLPELVEDLAVRLVRTDDLSLVRPALTEEGTFAFHLQSVRPGPCAIEESSNLRDWTAATIVEAKPPERSVTLPTAGSRGFYRARRDN